MCSCLLPILWRLVCLIDWPWGEQEDKQKTARKYSIFKNTISRHVSLAGQKVEINTLLKKMGQLKDHKFLLEITLLNLAERQLFPNIGDSHLSTQHICYWCGNMAEWQPVPTCFGVQRFPEPAYWEQVWLWTPIRPSAHAKLKECKTKSVCTGGWLGGLQTISTLQGVSGDGGSLLQKGLILHHVGWIY